MTQPVQMATPSLASVKEAIGKEFDYSAMATNKRRKALGAYAREVSNSKPNYAVASASAPPEMKKAIAHSNKKHAEEYEDKVQDALYAAEDPGSRILSEQIEVSRDIEKMDRKSLMNEIIDRFRKHENFNRTLLYIIIALCLLIFICTCVYKNKSSNFGSNMFGSTDNIGHSIHSFAE